MKIPSTFTLSHRSKPEWNCCSPSWVRVQERIFMVMDSESDQASFTPMESIQFTSDPLLVSFLTQTQPYTGLEWDSLNYNTAASLSFVEHQVSSLNMKYQTRFDANNIKHCHWFWSVLWLLIVNVKSYWRITYIWTCSLHKALIWLVIVHEPWCFLDFDIFNPFHSF